MSRSHVPIARARHQRGSWRIYWTHARRVYEATILDSACDARTAHAIAAQVSTALAGRAAWPVEIAGASAVRRYLDDTEPVAARRTRHLATVDVDDLLSVYRREKVDGKASPVWGNVVVGWLRELLAATDGLNGLATDTIGGWLDGRQRKPPHGATAPAPACAVSPGTYNKMRFQIGKFCHWLTEANLKPRDWDPLSGIPKARETKAAGDIAVLDDAWVDRALTATETLSDGVAVWVAVLAGLRRGEIAALLWEDIGASVITVRTSKTGEGRHAPLSARLRERLERAPHKGPRVVPWPVAAHGWMSAARRLVETKLPREYENQRQADIRAGTIKADADAWPSNTEWNVFRHTYASRLVRKGVPLDVVADWMGNSPDVCRRHYARFLPASGRDSRIDLVD